VNNKVVAKPKDINVENLKDFSSTLEQCLAEARARNPDARTVGNWYRGHGRADTYQLEPSLYRHPKIKLVKDLLQMESRMLDDFTRQNVLHTFQSRAETEEARRFETLFYMQHYGVPTRLLDWTVNPFMGLYFALTTAARSKGSDEFEEDAAVWILDPVSWNGKALEELDWKDKGAARPGDLALDSYAPKREYGAAEVKNMYELPVATLGVANNARMFAQRGVFTIFGKKLEPMETLYDAEKFPADSLVRVVIPKKKIDQLLTTLIQIGFTDSVTYPDLTGLAMEIRRLNGFRD
jgi:hypothetical protein